MWEIVLLLIVVLIVFGAGKLPQVMGDFAKGIKQFKAGMAETPALDGAAAPPREAAPTRDPVGQG